jgi:hypothetical protein
VNTLLIALAEVGLIGLGSYLRHRFLQEDDDRMPVQIGAKYLAPIGVFALVATGNAACGVINLADTAVNVTATPTVRAVRAPAAAPLVGGETAVPLGTFDCPRALPSLCAKVRMEVPKDYGVRLTITGERHEKNCGLPLFTRNEDEVTLRVEARAVREGGEGVVSGTYTYRRTTRAIGLYSCPALADREGDSGTALAAAIRDGVDWSDFARAPLPEEPLSLLGSDDRFCIIARSRHLWCSTIGASPTPFWTRSGVRDIAFEPVSEKGTFSLLALTDEGLFRRNRAEDGMRVDGSLLCARLEAHQLLSLPGQEICTVDDSGNLRCTPALKPLCSDLEQSTPLLRGVGTVVGPCALVGSDVHCVVKTGSGVSTRKIALPGRTVALVPRLPGGVCASDDTGLTHCFDVPSDAQTPVKIGEGISSDPARRATVRAKTATGLASCWIDGEGKVRCEGVGDLGTVEPKLEGFLPSRTLAMTDRAVCALGSGPRPEDGPEVRCSAFGQPKAEVRRYLMR